MPAARQPIAFHACPRRHSGYTPKRSADPETQCEPTFTPFFVIAPGSCREKTSTRCHGTPRVPTILSTTRYNEQHSRGTYEKPFVSPVSRHLRRIRLRSLLSTAIFGWSSLSRPTCTIWFAVRMQAPRSWRRRPLRVLRSYRKRTSRSFNADGATDKPGPSHLYV